LIVVVDLNLCEMSELLPISYTIILFVSIVKKRRKKEKQLEKMFFSSIDRICLGTFREKCKNIRILNTITLSLFD
ncbi:MAG: hypothetical protein ACKO4S_09855, partial [Snowella sp.]